MNNPETQAILDTANSTKTHKPKNRQRKRCVLLTEQKTRVDREQLHGHISKLPV